MHCKKIHRHNWRGTWISKGVNKKKEWRGSKRKKRRREVEGRRRTATCLCMCKWVVKAIYSVPFPKQRNHAVPELQASPGFCCCDLFFKKNLLCRPGRPRAHETLIPVSWILELQASIVKPRLHSWLQTEFGICL